MSSEQAVDRGAWYSTRTFWRSGAWLALPERARRDRASRLLPPPPRGVRTPRLGTLGPHPEAAPGEAHILAPERSNVRLYLSLKTEMCRLCAGEKTANAEYAVCVARTGGAIYTNSCTASLNFALAQVCSV